MPSEYRQVPPRLGIELTQRNITYDTKPFGFFLSIVVAVATVISGFVATSIGISLELKAVLIGTAIMVLPSALYAFMLPRLRVGFMASAWSVPQTTFLLSRPMVRLVGSTLVGNFIGAVLLAIIHDVTYWLVLLGLVPSCLVFFWSASHRLKRHPKSEFSMPLPFPYPFKRRMRR